MRLRFLSSGRWAPLLLSAAGGFVSAYQAGEPLAAALVAACGGNKKQPETDPAAVVGQVTDEMALGVMGDTDTSDEDTDTDDTDTDTDTSYDDYSYEPDVDSDDQNDNDSDDYFLEDDYVVPDESDDSDDTYDDDPE